MDAMRRIPGNAPHKFSQIRNFQFWWGAGGFSLIINGFMGSKRAVCVPKNSQKTPTRFLIPNAFRDEQIKSPYLPLGLFSCNINTSYNRDGNGAKRKSMIVRFV